MRVISRVALLLVALLAGLVAPGLSAPELGAPGLGAPAALAGPSTPVQPQIVGGALTATAQHPWMVALTTVASKSAYCGGALIAPDRVVTAAHCISGYRLGNVRVIAGRTDLRSDDGEQRRVRGVWIQPGYRSPVQGGDLAVLFLDRTLPYRTLSLETDPDAYRPGAPATVLGWGYTSEGGPNSSQLRSADVALIAKSACTATYRQFDSEEMLCAGRPRGGVDACYGDSGGPLVVGDRLIGVTSWGSGCGRADRPGVYTRVASYSAEINAQL
ncbi:MAG: serine protease [Actinomycetota bacterium]|nr:serine protease [Actinomycetota bacterium]